MLIADQVATAPCTDPIQAHFVTQGKSSFVPQRNQRIDFRGSAGWDVAGD